MTFLIFAVQPCMWVLLIRISAIKRVSAFPQMSNDPLKDVFKKTFLDLFASAHLFCCLFHRLFVYVCLTNSRSDLKLFINNIRFSAALDALAAAGFKSVSLIHDWEEVLCHFGRSCAWEMYHLLFRGKICLHLMLLSVCTLPWDDVIVSVLTAVPMAHNYTHL